MKAKKRNGEKVTAESGKKKRRRRRSERQKIKRKVPSTTAAAPTLRRQIGVDGNEERAAGPNEAGKIKYCTKRHFFVRVLTKNIKKCV